MKKTTFLLFLFSLLSFISRAQDSDTLGLGSFLPPDDFIDSIPEPELADGHLTYLKTFYSECMIEDSLNPACKAVRTQRVVNIPSSYQMNNLSWLKHFVNAEELNARYNYISILPDTFPSKLERINLYGNYLPSGKEEFGKLPEGLEYLNIGRQRSSLTELPELPESLKYLYVQNNDITTLPDSLPVSLESLNVSSNELTDLGNVVYLSDTMSYINLKYNEIKVLPDTLPSVLTTFILGDDYYSGVSLGDLSSVKFPEKTERINLTRCGITDLPVFGDSISTLYLDHNELTSIDSLPAGLKNLYASHNNIKTVKTLPEELVSLDINNNELSLLPALPSAMEYLDASYNNLSELPELPSELITLEVQHNSLSDLPVLPEGLTRLNVAKNDLVTVPAIPSTVTSLVLTDNNLTTLGTLPEGLHTLDISRNDFNVLPELPGTLRYLYCNSCGITGAFTIPEQVKGVSVDDNQITEIISSGDFDLTLLSVAGNNLTSFPYLSEESLRDLDISNNQIDSLYQNLGENLNWFEGAGNKFSCIPNFPESLRDTDIKEVCGYNCFTGKENNLWNEKLNWTAGRVPGSGEDVYIINSRVILSESSASANNVNMIGSSISSGSHVLEFKVYGDLNIKGSLVHANLRMAGSSLQKVFNASDYSARRLIIDNPAGVKFVGLSSIDPEYISIQRGTVDIPRIYLGSSGRLGEITASNPFSKVGSVSFTRRIGKGWNFIGSVYQGETFNDFKQDGVRMKITEIDGSVFSFEDDSDPESIGWIKPSSESAGFTPGKGWRFYGWEARFFYQRGTPFYGTKNLDVSYNSDGFEGGGWSFVSNPYIATIDWNDEDGWEKNNINDAVYVYNRSLKKYSYWVAGNSVNGGSSRIGPGQSFFVRANASGASLVVKESAKTQSERSVLRKSAVPQQKIRVSITEAEKGWDKDELLLVLNENSTPLFDGAYDAYKKVEGGANIYTVTAESDKLAISSFPEEEQDIIIPLYFENENSGTYIMSFDQLESLSDDMELLLLDHKENSMRVIEDSLNLTVDIDGGESSDYSLVLKTNRITATSSPSEVSPVSVFPNPFGDKLSFRSANKISHIAVSDIVGNPCISKAVAGQTSFDISTVNLSPGIYVVEVLSDKGKETFKIVKK